MWVKSNTWTVVKDLSQRPGWVAGNAIWYNSVTKANFFGPNVGLLADVRVDAFGRRHIGFGASVVSFSLSVETSIEICIGVVRIEPDSLAVVGDSALIVLLIFICERAVVEGDRDVFLCFRTRLN